MTSDPATKRWLLRHVDPVFGFPSIVRFSWATTRKLLHEKAYAVKWRDSLDEDQTAGERNGVDASTQRLDTFMRAADDADTVGEDAYPQRGHVITRFRFFQQHHLDILTSILPKT